MASAYSMQSINTLLANYNVPGALSRSLQPIVLNYSGTQYVGLYNASRPYFIINTSGSYGFVLNASLIAKIIGNYTVQQSLSQANFGQLATQMQLFRQSSAGPMADCYAETGLSTGATCTVANQCQACLQVPLCRCDLTGTFCPPNLPASQVPPGGGVHGIFGRGIIQFAGQYGVLNSSFNTFNSASLNVSKSNVVANLAKINSAYANITNITQSIAQNPIFPPSPSITPSQIAGCVSYVNQTTAPWYCSALGYCQSTSYNASKLAYINILLTYINSLTFSGSQLSALAYNVSSNESVYVYPILSKQKQGQLFAILNKTLPNYTTLVSNVAVLLTHIGNVTLQRELSAIQSNYSNLTANYFNANLSRVNSTMSKQYAKLSGDYARMNATYSAVLSGAQNNTAKIIKLQLYGQYNAKMSDLAFAQLAINGQLSAGRLSNLSKVSAQNKAVSQQLAAYTTSPVSFTELARSFDSGFIRWLAGSMGLSYNSAVGLAPILGSVLALLIGIFVLLLLLFARGHLKRSGRMIVNARTERNWGMIMMAAGIVVVLYVLGTYVLLGGAAQAAPYSAFQSAYKGSQSLFIAVNGTASAGMASCANTLSAQATAANKKPILANFTKVLCRVGNSTSTIDSCLNYYANLNVPVIVLTNSSHSSINLYSLYGTALNVRGNQSVMNTCYVSLLLK